MLNDQEIHEEAIDLYDSEGNIGAGVLKVKL
jgi:hypothetical protein